MNELSVYIKLGLTHIADYKGYDHILFIVTLCCIYKISDWKKIGVLVTAFTVGHSLTLALAALKIIVVNSYLVELLIPITILITCLLNLYYSNRNKHVGFHYALALCFGLIHGMGFSNFFTSIAIDDNILFELFGFNLGLELGQLLIVGLFFLLYYLVSLASKINHKYWQAFFSGVGGMMAIMLIIQRI